MSRERASNRLSAVNRGLAICGKCLFFEMRLMQQAPEHGDYHCRGKYLQTCERSAQDDVRADKRFAAIQRE